MTKPMKVIELSLNARAQFPHETFRPYLIGGIGYTHIGQDVININYYDDFNIPPIPLLGSVSFYSFSQWSFLQNLIFSKSLHRMPNIHTLKNFQPFIQASYVVSFTDETNTVTIPVKFGFVFTLR